MSKPHKIMEMNGTRYIHLLKDEFPELKVGDYVAVNVVKIEIPERPEIDSEEVTD